MESAPAGGGRHRGCGGTRTCRRRRWSSVKLLYELDRW